MKISDFFVFVYDVYYIIQLVAISASLIIVFYPFKKTVKSVLIAAAHFLFLYAMGTLLNFGIFGLSQICGAFAGINFHISWLIIVFLYLCFFIKIPLQPRIIMGAVLYSAIIIMADFGHYFPIALAGSIASHFNYFGIIADILTIAFAFVMRRLTLQHYYDIPWVSSVMILIDSAASVGFILYRTIMNIHEGENSHILYSVALLVLWIFIFVGYMMIYFHCKVRKEKTALEVQNKLLEADKQMLVVSEQAIEEMRALRHDMRNQRKVMGLMLEEGRYDELKEYFRSVADDYEKNCLSEFIDCGNSLINSVINMEILKATSYGVKLVSKISVPPQLPFESSDLCRVLVNLIDNAIEGVMRTDSKDYLIDVKIGKRADYLYISVQNEIRDDTDRETLLKMNTVKDDAVNHGYGHKIVKKIVDKYNGCVNYTVSENEFIAEVMLDLTAA